MLLTAGIQGLPGALALQILTLQVLGTVAQSLPGEASEQAVPVRRTLGIPAFGRLRPGGNFVRQTSHTGLEGGDQDVDNFPTIGEEATQISGQVLLAEDAIFHNAGFVEDALIKTLGGQGL